MRILNFVSFCFAVASAFLLYSLNYDTRRLEAQLQARERDAGKTRSDIAVLKAERAHLSRPERIDTAARALGLAPPRSNQMIGTLTSNIETGTTPAGLRER